jgi:hypothetical protein
VPVAAQNGIMRHELVYKGCLRAEGVLFALCTVGLPPNSKLPECRESDANDS